MLPENQSPNETAASFAGDDRLRDWLKTAAGNASFALFILDARQRCVFMNPAAERLCGFDFQEIKNKSLDDIIRRARSDGRPYLPEENSINRAFSSGEQAHGEETLVHKDGTFRPVAFTASPIRENGASVGTVVEFRSVAREKEFEFSLRAAAAENERLFVEAREANRLKDDFLATVSHELRTPLNAITGWSSLLLSTKMDEDAKHRAVETINRNARAQAQIIDDILDISRIISGKLRLDVRLINPGAVIESAVESARPAADAKGIRLQLLLDPQAGPVSGDPDRLQQIVWNLISNAVKFTPKGGRIQVRLERINSHVEIVVSDTGQGIAPDFLPHVFEPFRQNDSSTSRAFGGLGLGLSIVRQLVELHGGTVAVVSPGDGAGATFTVTLPVAVVRARSFKEAERVHPRASENAVPFDCPPQFKGLRVLIVDDEKDARELLQTVLGQCQADVLTASSAAEAFEKIAEFNPHILVSDIGMPDEDGYKLIRKVRAREKKENLPRIPAVALTAYARVDDRLKALAAGFQMHVPKPVEPAELAAVITSLTDWENRPDAD